uniref:Uncharacterized protein n=1 Tax=Panagrolaimus superbus TaxID=310955 RepID=A0A914YXT3_9BILA
MAGMAIDGKDKGEAENEAKPIDVKSLLPHTCDLASDHPYQSGTRTAVPDYFAAGDFRGVLLTGRLLRRCAGNYRLRGCHYGAVRVRGDDAQPGRFRNRTGTPVAETAGVDWSGNFVGHHAGGDCLRHPRC